MTFIKTTATRLITLTLSSLLAISVQAAETMSHDMGQMQGMTMSATQQKTYPLNGRVVAVDNANLQVTLEHDAVTELQWPAMTMPLAITAVESNPASAAAEYFHRTSGWAGTARRSAGSR